MTSSTTGHGHGKIWHQYFSMLTYWPGFYMSQRSQSEPKQHTANTKAETETEIWLQWNVSSQYYNSYVG